MASNSTNNDVGNGVMLTDDLVIEILLWLPVVSLLRFKSVCKSWVSLIQSSRFISQHNSNNHQLLILKHNEVSPGPYCMLLSSPPPSFIDDDIDGDGDENSGSCSNNNNSFSFRYQVSKKLDLPKYFQNNPREIRFAKIISCNGIICLLHSDWAWDVSLWNPATKQFRILPKTHFHPPPKSCRVSIGFGFDFKTNDFKVVRLVFYSSIRDPVNKNKKYVKVEVYSLTTNSWKSFGNLDLPIDSVISDPKMSYKNGEIYCWMGRVFKAGDRRICILSYNFSTEAFEIIPLPKHDWDSFRSPTLAILRGKIAVIASIKHAEFSEDNYVSHYQICVMNEYGVKDSWTTMYTVGPFSFLSQPAGFSKNGDLLLFRKAGPNQQQLCLFDLATHQIRNLPGKDSSETWQVLVYKESLFSVE